MTTESVKYLIDAEDRATAKIRKTTAEVNKQVSQVKEIGGQSKASTELVGTLATSLGGTGVGAFAGEISMLTERVSAFSEVSKAGGVGALAFKAGLAGAAGVISFKVGKALGDVIFQTEKWNKKLEEAHELAQRLGSQLDQLSIGRSGDETNAAINAGPEAIAKRLAVINRELGGIGQQSESAKRQLREIDESWTLFYGREDQELRLNSAIERGMKLTQERIRLVQSANKISKADQRDNAVLASLRMDIEKAAATTFEDRTRLEMFSRGVSGKAMEEAIKLASLKKRIDDANAKAKEDAAQKAIAAEKAIADAEKSRLKARRDGLDAIIKKENEVTRNLKDQVADLKKNDKSTLTGPLQAGASQRLTTGRAAASFKKTAAVIEAERQTKIQKSQEKLMVQIAASLQRMEKAKTGIKVLGN